MYHDVSIKEIGDMLIYLRKEAWGLKSEVGVGLPEFKWNFRKFKQGLKGKKRQKVMEHHQTVEPQVGGQLFGVHLPIFNFKF